MPTLIRTRDAAARNMSRQLSRAASTDASAVERIRIHRRGTRGKAVSEVRSQRCGLRGAVSEVPPQRLPLKARDALGTPTLAAPSLQIPVLLTRGAFWYC